MNETIRNLFRAAAFVAAAAIGGTAAFAQDSIRLAVTDIDGMAARQREMGPFKAAFEVASGPKIGLFSVSGRTVAVEALIAGDIAATGLNRTHIEQITEKFLDQKFGMLVQGPELPDDVLLASPTVMPEVLETVRKTFADNGNSLLAAVTATEENAKFVGGSFTDTVADADYDGVRKMFENVGVTEFAVFLE